MKIPDIAEPVIGRTFARGLIRAGIDGAVPTNRTGLRMIP